jgi:protease I
MNQNTETKTVLFVIPATGFSREQYKPTKEELEDSGVSVLTVSDVHGDAISKEEFRAKVDMTFDEVDMQQYDGVVFFGGPGAERYLNNRTCYEMLRSADKLEKIIGGIQVAPRILARAGVLEDKQATGWNEDDNLRKIFDNFEAEYKDKEVVKDKNVITAKNAEAATKFAHSLSLEL